MLHSSGRLVRLRRSTRKRMLPYIVALVAPGVKSRLRFTRWVILWATLCIPIVWLVVVMLRSGW